ncbi:MAG: hypothetical protein M1486_03960 [Gammaproteobacteria bacterium]|nr:hypothetical protein [Gammaproteobacteria bacterium]
MYYRNETLLLASKHEKERVIRPIFRDKIGCEIYTSDFDTDQFGTFTGEIPRTLNAYETCISKARAAAIANECLFSIASEGSFGMHPSIPFITSDHEIMVFMDLKNNWVIAEQLVTSKTNYNTLTLHPGSEIVSFLRSVQFPEHAVILQVSHSKEILGKGIQDQMLLDKLIKKGFTKGDELLLATDMRAMMNPTRMEALSKLAEKLAARILSCCPACGSPGFGLVTTTEKLSCSLCGAPTSLHRFDVWSCIYCEHKEKRIRGDHLKKADATYCTFCNP